jgi:cytidylate kinase
MSALVVAFSGGIKGGKSSVSREVAARLGRPRVSFGDQVRSVVRSRGLDASDREALQSVGQELVDTDARDFSQAVLSQAGTAWTPGRNLIIDGLRHVEVATALRGLVKPSDLRVILIDADLTVRATRAPGQAVASDLARWGQHPTEVQIANSIPKIADFIIDGAQPLEKVVSEAVSWIQDRVTQV